MWFRPVWTHQGSISSETENRVEVEGELGVKCVAELKLLILSEWGGARAESYGLPLFEVCD